MDDRLAFRIGSSNREHVVVSPNRREFEDCKDYWDGNWVYAMVTIAAGAFRGEFEAMLRTEDFVRFRDALRPLYANLEGRAIFATMEEWLRIDIAGDGKGHFHAKCSAIDQPGTGNTVTFGADFDQTELPEILRALDSICDALPVVGKTPGAR